MYSIKSNVVQSIAKLMGLHHIYMPVAIQYMISNIICCGERYFYIPWFEVRGLFYVPWFEVRGLFMFHGLR
jgi:hypothetical protein